MLKTRFAVVAVFALCAAFVAPLHAELEVYDLRCDGAENPLGIDAAPPRVSWKLHGAARGARQTAWQLLVASSAENLAQNRGDLWDSGRRESDEQLNVPYGGPTLHSAEQVYWKVRVWDRDGQPSAWSEPATWTMGVLAATDWQARWITDRELLRWVRPKAGYHSTEAADEKETKWVCVDLGRAQPIATVRLYPMRQVIEEAQGLPIRFKIEAADEPEFRAPQLIADHTAKDFVYASTAQKTTVPTFVVKTPVTARYVRVITSRLRRDGSTCYLALSQIEVVAGEKNVAAGARVTAKDSVENEMWSAAAVTDGLDVRGANPRENGTLLARREFVVKPELRRALVNICGLGHYELSVNGRRVGEDLLAPGWTTYAKTDLYDTHDVTALVRAGGPNAVGVFLGGGFYNVRPGRYTKLEGLFHPLTVICQVRLEYADGSVDVVGTDDRWRVHPGPITFSSMYGGEDFDARQVETGWDSPGFNASGWATATVTNGPGGELLGASHAAPPLRAIETLRPVAIKALRADATVYDLGQNVSLMPRLRVRGPAGATVKIIPAELIKTDGSVDRSSCSRGTGEAWWSYTLAGRADGEEWMPKFFYHGSRYLQVELSAPGTAALPVIESLEGLVVHTSSPAAGEFACSNELFNRVHTLVRWAQRSNAMSVLTDCPHRERLGWLEQYHLNGPALRYEFDLGRFYAKAFGDMADAQLANGLVPDIAPEYVIFSGAFRDSPEWGSAFILAAWQHFEWTGDDTILRRHYDAMRRYVAYLSSQADAQVLSYGLGDWYDIGPKPPGISQLTPLGLTATATYYEDVKTLAAIARHLDKTADAHSLAKEAEDIAAAFNRKFFDSAQGIYSTGSQCANAIALVFGLVAPGDRARVVDALVRDVQTHGLTAGDVGYRYLLRALADAGRSDVIFALNSQTEKAGYGYQLAHGATSLTEAWDTRRTSSQNHFMLGQINEWFYHDLAGLAPDVTASGFKHVIIHPQPVGDVTWVRAAYVSPRGKITVAWRREAGHFELECELPPNTSATVFIPGGDAADVTEGGLPAAQQAGVQFVRTEATGAVFEVEAGKYKFAVVAK